jgi:FtsP/CotA-like multicopper oxidase with cupredoxin domain
MDQSGYIDVTFWAHAERINEIPDDELSMAVIAIEGATISFYSGAYTLNVGQRAEVIINPENELAENWSKLVEIGEK